MHRSHMLYIEYHSYSAVASRARSLISFTCSALLTSQIWWFDLSFYRHRYRFHWSLFIWSCRRRRHVSSPHSLLSIYFSLLFKSNWTRFWVACVNCFFPSFNNFPFIRLLFWDRFCLPPSLTLFDFIMTIWGKTKRINWLNSLSPHSRTLFLSLALFFYFHLNSIASLFRAI